MAKASDAQRFEEALRHVNDEASFIQKLLIDLLDWPIDQGVKTVQDITYDWSKDDLKAANLDKKVLDGQIRQLVLEGCPWGIFLVEFKNPDVFTTGRGMTVPLRQILNGLVPKQKKAAHLPSFFREHLLFICTCKFQYFRFVHFKSPGASLKQPALASFGWWPGDSTKTVSTYNLPNLAFLDDTATVDDWIAAWTKAFDVERVTKKFYLEYKDLHKAFADAAQHVPHANDRPWLASVVLNRLMFVYFLQRKGFIDGGKQHYLEEKLAASKKLGKNQFYDRFLSLLFFEGFAKPEPKRSAAAKKVLGDIRYLNGGLFLEHPIEQAARAKGKPVDWPDSVFDAALKFFGSFSWNLNDVPGGEDNEINPDVLGYILEKYVNQKAFGAYYTRPEITGYLCERTIHRLVLDAVNTPPATVEAVKKAGLPIRKFDSVAQLIKKLDDKLATRLLDDALPSLSLLDPACGSGAFLVAAMKTLIDIYQGVLGWIPFHGSAELKARLAKIHKDHASLDYFIKHRIITDNLYGVDLMPEAVEIARLRLFLSLAASVENVEQLEPLPNIDFNVMDGNSLIGLLHVDAAKVTSANLFDKPYDQIIADRDRRLETYRHTAGYADDLTGQRDAITAINDRAQKLLNLLLLGQFESLGIKFEQATWDDAKGKAGKPRKRPLTPEDVARLHPFHWAFAFSKVMGRGGFDAIITNPPWEVFETNEKEFFQQYEPAIQKKNIRIEDWKEQYTKLMGDELLRSAWLEYESQFSHQQLWFKQAREYEHQQPVDTEGKKIASKINLYKLFVERCFRLLRPSGQCGIVIPGGIYSDLGAKGLRELLFDECVLADLRSFTNERFIFDAIHHAFKFCLLIFSRGDRTTCFGATFNTNVPTAVAPETLGDFLDDRDSMLPIEVSLLRKLSPDSLSVIEFKSLADITIAQRFLRFPALGKTVDGKWWLRLGQEFNMTTDSDLFQNEFAPGRLPLYEGKMIWHFDHLHSKPKYFLNEAEARRRLAGERHGFHESLEYESYRYGYREIASNTNERGFVSTILPPRVFANHKLILSGKSVTNPEALLLCGITNSYCFDYQVRQRTSTTVSMFMFYQLPVPRLTAADTAFAPIVERSAKLICTTPEFDELAKEAGLTPSDHTAGVTDPAGRAKLRAELDAMVAHLYGLTGEQFAHVLDTFALVDPAVRAAALNEFTRMIETGEAATFNPELAKPPSSPAAAAVVDPTAAVKELIAKGESASLKFKSTARWDVKQNKPGPYLERVIVKTIAAFLNAKGGTLIIGVEDDGKVQGLQEDYKLCGNKGRDGFENWLMQTLMKDFGKDAAGQLSVAFVELGAPNPQKPGTSTTLSAGSGDVCVVTAKPSPKPRFVVEDNREVFYIRTGNATNALKMSEFLNYCAHRWPGGIEQPEVSTAPAHALTS